MHGGGESGFKPVMGNDWGRIQMFAAVFLLEMYEKLKKKKIIWFINTVYMQVLSCRV